jgi:chemotaxis signal transduction protein
MQELVLFQTGDMKLAIDQNDIIEIRPMADDCILTRGCLQQVIETRDGLLLLIDIASYADHATPPAPSPNARLIHVKGTPPYVLLADDIIKTLQAGQSQMEVLPPVFADTACACFPKVLRTENQLALVVDTIALGELKVDMHAVPDQWWAQQLKLEEYQETPTTDIAPPVTPSSACASDTLETKVGEILRKIITQRVEKKVAETMALTLETSFG